MVVVVLVRIVRIADGITGDGIVIMVRIVRTGTRVILFADARAPRSRNLGGEQREAQDDDDAETHDPKTLPPRAAPHPRSSGRHEAPYLDVPAPYPSWFLCSSALLQEEARRLIRRPANRSTRRMSGYPIGPRVLGCRLRSRGAKPRMTQGGQAHATATVMR